VTKRVIGTIFGALAIGSIIIFSAGYFIACKLVFRHQLIPSYLKRVEEHRFSIIKDSHAEPVSFITRDGVKLSGLLVTRDQAKRTILMCHGFLRTKETMRHFAKMFPEDNILMFDFRAHGQSEGEFCSIGHYERHDVMAALAFINTHETTKETPVVGVGASMGAATLLAAAAHGANFQALILDSSFARLEDQIAHIFYDSTGLPQTPFMPAARLIFEYIADFSIKEFNPEEHASQVNCPVLIIHSKDDKYTPVESAHKIYARLEHDQKDLWLVSDAEHARIGKHYPQEYQKRVDSFLKRCVA